MDDEDNVTNEDDLNGEASRGFLKDIIVFVVVILIIVGILLALAPPESNTIPTDDELYQDWLEQNYTPRYDEP